MSLTAQEQRLLIEYAEVFSIRPGDYSNNEEEAYHILATLYGFPSIERDYEKRRFQAGLVTEVIDVFGDNSRFFQRVIEFFAMYNVQPAWFSGRESNDELIREFKRLLVGATVLMALGISPVGGSARRGVEESIRQGSVRAGVLRARQRLLQGAGSGIIEALTQRVATRFPVGAAIVALGVIAYFAMERRMNEIREIMTERFEADLATEEELDQISNASFVDVVMETVDAYWD